MNSPFEFERRRTDSTGLDWAGLGWIGRQRRRRASEVRERDNQCSRALPQKIEAIRIKSSGMDRLKGVDSD